MAIGPAAITLGTYTASGGAGGSQYDVGHTKGPLTLAVSYEEYELKSEQGYGTLRKVPLSAKVKLKVSMSEATLKNLQYALRQADAKRTGTPPNETLLFGPIQERYHQLIIVTKAYAGATLTYGTRTITVWKAIVESVAEISYGKGVEQNYEVTFDCLYDETVNGGEFMKWVDSGVS